MPDPVILENGLRVLVLPVPHARSVALSAYVAAGSRYEQDAEAGLSHFVEHLAFKGTERRPRPQDISIEIDSVGGSINAATEREYTLYYAKVTPRHTRQTLDVLVDMLRNSLFLPAEIERERGVILEELAAVEDSPDEQVGIVLDSLLWPGQPHGRDIAGSPATVKAISQERLVAYYRGQYVPNATVVSIAGAVTHEEGLALARELLSDWAPGTPTTWAPHVDVAGPRVQVIAKDTEQAHVSLGMIGAGARDPRRFALGVLSVIIGEGMSSRLFLRLREELGLCYDIRSSLTQLLDTGSFAVYAGVDPTNAIEALREIGAELRRAREPASQEEFDRAKVLLGSRLELFMEDTQAVAGWYGGRAVRGLPLVTPEETIAAYEAVTLDQVTAVAREVLTDARLRVSVVGPFEAADPLLQAVQLDG
jgi:predicted Zn-dependent peptidase